MRRSIETVIAPCYLQLCHPYRSDMDYMLRRLDALRGAAGPTPTGVHFSELTWQYTIHGVTGPNEYERTTTSINWQAPTASWPEHWAVRHLRCAPRRRSAAELASQRTSLRTWLTWWRRCTHPEDAELHLVQHVYLPGQGIRCPDIPAGERPSNQHWSWTISVQSVFDWRRRMYCRDCTSPHDHLYDVGDHSQLLISWSP